MGKFSSKNKGSSEEGNGNLLQYVGIHVYTEWRRASRYEEF